MEAIIKRKVLSLKKETNCYMNEYPVKILEASYINYNVKRFVVEKPEGFTFVPGQATEVALDLPGWKDKLRPFTPT